ncbi:hypothetical protein [Proteiniclasticum sp.]|uniref:hypothetical protein n=1 Tax=Proteiniclasticum sp. TaxID=2053595 RepID=UPI00289C9B0F|nr:hypothetical protein [Proteiniclasticum sp.]
MKTIEILTDNLKFEVTTHVEYGNLHIKIEDPFEKYVSEIMSPEDIKILIEGLQNALKENELDEE